MYAFGNRSAVTNELYSIMADRGRQLRNLLKEMSQIDHQIVDLGGQSQRLKYEEIARGRKKQKMEGQERSNSNEQSERMSYSTKKIKQIQLREQEEEKQGLSEKKNQIMFLERKYAELQGNLEILMSDPESRERSLSIIETDIPRTFATTGFFKPDGQYHG
jgi:DNA repair ATPase RecN